MERDGTATVAKGILELVGDTPLLRLGKITQGLQSNVLAKLEYLNPSGSIKDRMALRMIEDAERAGRLKPGGTVVESSTGNTGIALAFVCAVKGYALRIFAPDTVWHREKRLILDRFGAAIELVPLVETQTARDAGVHGARVEIGGKLRCREEEERDGSVFWTRQFSNPANVAAQSEVGREILRQSAGKVDVFVAAIGTGGTLLGVAQTLKRELPAVRIVAVEPTEWPGFTDPLSPEATFIPGISGGIVEQIRDSGIVDEIAYVGNSDARDMAYRLSREEGLFCGVSSGANVFVALNEARKLGAGKNVVTVLVDRGDRYFSDDRFIT